MPPLSSGCLPRYVPGTLTGRPDTRVTVGCLDLQWEPVNDLSVPRAHVAVRFAFGNRCDRAVPVDLRRARVTARGEGTEVAFALRDPRGEVTSAVLEAYLRAEEVLEFAPTGTVPESATTLCVDAGGLTDHTAEVPGRCVPWHPPAPDPETQVPQ